MLKEKYVLYGNDYYIKGVLEDNIDRWTLIHFFVISLLILLIIIIDPIHDPSIQLQCSALLHYLFIMIKEKYVLYGNDYYIALYVGESA